jgi:hypothetical protein
MADPSRSGQRVTAAETRARVIELRRRRATFDDIGRALGISRQRAHQIYCRSLAEIPAADLAEHRAEELTLIDDAIRDLMPIARDHTQARSAIEAWNAIRGWTDRKARLLGLDAPAQHKIDVITEDTVNAEIARLEAQIGPQS